MIDALVVIVFPLLMIFACLTDLMTLKIPNRVPILLVITFCALAAFLEISWRDFGLHVACGFAFLSFAFTLFSMGVLGGGDGKLGAAVAMWFGFPLLLEFAISVSLIGGLLAAALVIFRRFPLPDALLKIKWVVQLHDQGGPVPYGIAIGFSGLLLYPQSLIWFSYMQSGIR
jgi:prepilin peptidase CpaA